MQWPPRPHPRAPSTEHPQPTACGSIGRPFEKTQSSFAAVQASKFEAVFPAAGLSTTAKQAEAVASLVTVAFAEQVALAFAQIASLAQPQTYVAEGYATNQSRNNDEMGRCINKSHPVSMHHQMYAHPTR